jgi:hypothetical protein
MKKIKGGERLTVFYTASYYGKEKYQAYYDLIHEVLKGLSVTVISPEAKNYLTVLPKKVMEQLKDPKLIHYEAIKRGIIIADAVIIEISQEDFQLGHEATLAIMEKKPVLCLSLHEDFSKKIKHDFFFASHYRKETIRPTIQDFLAKVREMSLSKRFNLFLYPQQFEYIAKVGKQQGINMSEYLRLLINRDRYAVTDKSADLDK